MLRKKPGKVVWYKNPLNLMAVFLFSFFFVMNLWMISRIEDLTFYKTTLYREKLRKVGIDDKKTIYARLLDMAAHALAENKVEPEDLWEEPYVTASYWKPCADQRDWQPNCLFLNLSNDDFNLVLKENIFDDLFNVLAAGNNGYIMISANGGMNQQRVAVCNAVAVARLLNATLVLPKFLYSDVWNDSSQFGDIYQEEHFVDYLKPDVQIVKQLPNHLQSLDLDAIGSVVTDADIEKEAIPSFFLKYILPILRLNKIVHFIGFGNRLAFDPVPSDLQRLRCRCNFHALKFVPKIEEAGALLVQRMRKNSTIPGPLDRYLVGSFAEPNKTGERSHKMKDSRYLALHMRFEIDMVAHSLCDFGGGEEEHRELEAYRKLHFPRLKDQQRNKKKSPSAAALKLEGLCPLMPEETVLMLVALGFNSSTRIFLAGSQIYGGKSRLSVLTTLFPNLETKENLLSSSEIQPFSNFSSQLAALDFIGCTAADAFAITDPGSHLSSLVSGYRIYYGGGKMTTIRPNKRRLADIFSKNNTIEWTVFQERIKKAIRQGKMVFSRPFGRSVYGYPRCNECMNNLTESTET